MAVQFVQLNNKSRVNSKKYYYGDLTNTILSGQIGALLPEDCVVLDIDSTDSRSSYYIDWLKGKYPNVFITKTPKAGGYHVWFKTSRKFKKTVGVMSIFGWPYDILVGTNNYIVMPDNYEGRRYLNGFKSLAELAAGWDEYDVELDNVQDLMPGAMNVSGSNILECKEGSRNDDLISWLGAFCARGVQVEKIKRFTRTLARITGLNEHEIETTVLSSLEKYEKRDSSVYETGEADKINVFAGEDYYSTMMKLVDYILENKIAGFDEATGTGYFKFGKESITGMTVKDLKNKLVLYFGDKLYYTQGAGEAKKLSRIPVSDRNVLFDELFTRISYNSRHEIYEQLPAWDLQPRINNFLKTYYDCDTNPHLFWLFMTALVGKLKEPDKCYVPYFFDLIGNAGCVRGKTKVNVKFLDLKSKKVCAKTIKNLYEMQQAGRKFLIRTMNEDTHKAEYCLGKVVYNGRKPTYKVTLEDGKATTATADHKFMTRNGWKELQQLTIGDEILLGDLSNRKKHHRPPQDAECFVKYHPSASVKSVYDKKTRNTYVYFRLKYYHVVYEAHLNNMTVKEYLWLLDHYDGRGLKFLPSGTHIHHIDGDHTNNNINNLVAMSREDHSKLHSQERVGKSHNYYVEKYSKVVSIKRSYGNNTIGCLEQDVYDIKCAGNHNYFANGMLVHNCGKTLLCHRLSNGWVEVLSPGRSADDALVNVYKNNALIALDDECSFFKSVVGKGSGYEWWKQFITNANDTFSRKFQQPETHPRSFIVVRTSNEPKTSFWIDERRQIIFESKLKKDECKILSLSKEYFAQMLAEAKVFYERNGVYQLTDDDKLSIQMQQAQYFSTENEYYQQAKEYIDWVCGKLKDGKFHSFEDSQCWVKTPVAQFGYAITWMTYAKWCTQHTRKPMLSGLFWNQVGAIARQTGKVIKSSQRLALDGIATTEFASVVYNPDDIKLPEYNTTPEDINLIEEFENADIGNSVSVDSNMINELNAIRIKALETETKLVPTPDIDRWLPHAVTNFFNTTTDKIIPTTLTINKLDITYGLGGVHYAKKDWNNDGVPVIYLDVQSMYPNIMVRYNLLSRAVRHKNTFKNWIDERLKAKAEGNKKLADELKLKINSVYGNMKNPNSPLYDPSYGSSIAVLGQKVMTILVMGLQSKGCNIVNLNTDGVMFTYDKADPFAVNSFVKKWESVFGLTLTQKTYTEFQQADVNNYRAVDTDGNVITKGKKFKPDA